MWSSCTRPAGNTCLIPGYRFPPPCPCPWLRNYVPCPVYVTTWVAGHVLLICVVSEMPSTPGSSGFPAGSGTTSSQPSATAKLLAVHLSPANPGLENLYTYCNLSAGLCALNTRSRDQVIFMSAVFSTHRPRAYSCLSHNCDHLSHTINVGAILSHRIETQIANAAHRDAKPAWLRAL